MLVICEDCAKKYNIDESRIKGRRARFTCNECGHIIIIDKADIARPLVQKQDTDYSSSPTIDLLREMEAPFGLDNPTQEPAATAEPGAPAPEAAASTQPVTDKKGTTIGGYFLIGSFLSFLIITGGIGYLYTTFIAQLLSQQVQVRADLIVQSLLVLGGGWILVFLLLFCLARFVSKSLVRLTEDANRIALGERDRQIQPRGPKEVKEMALVLKQLTK